MPTRTPNPGPMRRRLTVADPHALVAEFNAAVAPAGSVVADIHRFCIRYSITQLHDAIHNQDIYEVINRLSKADLSRPIIIDLSSCRVVSSVDLAFIGYVLNQTRFHRGKAIIVGANRINAKALAMVGFERMCTIGGDADLPPA